MEKKTIAAIIAVGLGIAGALFSYDFKGAVCGSAESAAVAK